MSCYREVSLIMSCSIVARGIVKEMAMDTFTPSSSDWLRL